MRVYLGSDHAGFNLKEKVFAHLSKLNYDVEDEGDKVLDPNDDYPQFALAVATKVLGDTDPDARGILLCGSGQGMCIAANRVRGIRASVVWDQKVARETRNDNNSNVLCIPANMLNEDEVLGLVDVWLSAPFSGAARHVRRIKEIEELYG
ncbi:MAG: RpiB/LacA/LacB family sugar-phosphate isomerase [Candidatus Woesebacteria bacterium]|jgi:ribose 5-phosphate isomerase B